MAVPSANGGNDILRLSCSLGLIALSLASCRPPAADDYLERVELQQRDVGARIVQEDPDTANAIWVPVENSGGGGRPLFGNPGEAPMLSLACENGRSDAARIALVRYVQADPQARGMIALIGNSHIARMPVETQWNGRAWLWQGSWDAGSSELEVFTGNREVEATIPGAGTLLLTGSLQPGQLISDCRPDLPEEAEQDGAILPPE